MLVLQFKLNPSVVHCKLSPTESWWNRAASGIVSQHMQIPLSTYFLQQPFHSLFLPILFPQQIQIAVMPA